MTPGQAPVPMDDYTIADDWWDNGLTNEEPDNGDNTWCYWASTSAIEPIEDET